MAGSFGYEAAHYDVSMKMAELSLLPAIRKANADTLIVADGTSCRHQIADGTKSTRKAVHAVCVRPGHWGRTPQRRHLIGRGLSALCCRPCAE